MNLRSWLFIPADSEKKLSKVDETRADAFLLDMEDSVAPSRKQVAREMLPAFLKERPKQDRKHQLWVRINPLDSEHALSDLAAVVGAEPDGIMLPKANGPQDVVCLSNYLSALETASGVALGATRILPLVTETASASLTIHEYVNAQLPRVHGLTWGAEDLSAALGASSNKDENGEWAFTYKMVRAQTLLAARAMNVQAVDTLYVDFRDPEGLATSCKASRIEGFSGRLAIHPAQVEVINRCYMPTAEEVELAQQIVDAFDSQPGLGTIGIDGKMYDMPHLKQARRTLETFHAYNKTSS